MEDKYSKQQLLAELVRFNDTFGRMPIGRDLKSTSGFPSGSTFTRRFGSLQAARDLAMRRC
ncbi:hypothetical protein [Bacteroides sp.]|uniref:homing endonuclease associated repeat-containing protein n=1 Tax=Bacteroides sp. TaxID=29523 RepID=UPI00345D8BC7